MTFLRWLARSRRRLFICALVCLAGLFAAAGPVADHIRDHSDSVTADTLVLTLWLLALLIGALCLAILVGDRVFGERWRLRVICGEPDPPTDEDFLLIGPPSSHFFGLSVILGALIALGAYALEAATDGFLADYQRNGHKRSILRGDNEPLKLELVSDLAEVRREAFVRDAVTLLDVTWRDPSQSAEVRRTAIVSVGRLGYSLVTSMQSWVKHGVMEHWEIPLVRFLRREVGPDLLALARQPASEHEAEIYLALGKLRHTEGVEALLRRAEAPPRGTPWKAAVVGLGLAHDETSLARLTALLAAQARGLDPSELAALGYALGEVARHYVPGSDKAIDGQFADLAAAVGGMLGPEGVHSDSLPRDHVRCVAADILRKTGATSIAEPLFTLFDAEGTDVNCEPIHVDTGEKAPELVVRTEPLRLRILRALGLIAVGNEVVLDWVRERKGRPEYGEFIQSQLRRVLELTGEPSP